jgi:hypothetical protein
MTPPFPLNAAVVKLTPTASNDSDTLSLLPSGSTIRVYNTGPSTAFVKTSKAATTTAVVDESCPIPAGAIESFAIDTDHRSVGAICASGGTATVYVQRGTGI